MAPVLAAPGRLDPTLHSAIFALGLALVMAVFVLHPMGLGAAKMLARFQGLGARSYTLYVLHTPILVFMAALWMRERGALPGSGWIMMFGVAVAVALAYAVAPFVELPFSARSKLRASAPSPEVSPRARRIAARVSHRDAGASEEVVDERQAA